MGHGHVPTDLLGYLDTLGHLLVLALVLWHLLTNLLSFVFANLLGNFMTIVGRSPIAGLVGGSALLLVNCLANFLLVIFADIVVDGLAFLLQLLFAFDILSLPALSLHNVLTNFLDIIHTFLHLKLIRRK